MEEFLCKLKHHRQISYQLTALFTKVDMLKSIPRGTTMFKNSAPIKLRLFDTKRFPLIPERLSISVEEYKL